MRHDKVLILDFGSQYTQLIARRIREMQVYCEIQPYTFSLKNIEAYNPKAIILSGGPASVLSKDAYTIDQKILEIGVPVLGVCYGMQLMVKLLGGKLEASSKREYGKSELQLKKVSALFSKIPKDKTLKVWMSHGDSIVLLPEGVITTATSESSAIAAFHDSNERLFGLQFHPEVAHTEQGTQIISNFVLSIAKCNPSWTMRSFIDDSIEKVRAQVRDRHVILGVSGGVDSSVTAFLLNKAIPKQLTLIFVDNGLMRKDEAKKVKALFEAKSHMDLLQVDASERFISALKGVSDPEKKRKIIGRVFIEVFEAEAKKIPNVTFLAQGTLYPDVIESVSFKGPSATIKTHHNVGGLPDKMNLELIEPLRELFKDEVRELGRELKMPDAFISRQPFPGPGLGVRILGNVTHDRLTLLKAADDIVVTEIKAAGLYKDIWQSFAVLLPVKTVGVMGDERTYENVVALRAVTSNDGMTADWVPLPYELLGKISNRIINEVRGVNRVVYDISSKPPSTIEWE